MVRYWGDKPTEYYCQHGYRIKEIQDTTKRWSKWVKYDGPNSYTFKYKEPKEYKKPLTVGNGWDQCKYKGWGWGTDGKPKQDKKPSTVGNG